MNKKDDLVFIKHILESIDAIEEFSQGLNKEELASSRLKQSAIVREIEVIGEAAKNISSKLKNKNKDIEWRAIVGTRDKMIHHYFGVDLGIVFSIAKKEVPILKKQIVRIKKALEISKKME